MREYIAEENPEWILIYDQPPPIGKAVHLLMEYGGCIKAAWHPEYGAIAWRALPKLLPQQRRRLQALRGAGLDPTRHWSKQVNAENNQATDRLLHQRMDDSGSSREDGRSDDCPSEV